MFRPSCPCWDFKVPTAGEMFADGADPRILRRISDERRTIVDSLLLPLLVGMIEIERVEELVYGIAETFLP
jgi:hypothetical protein